MHFRSRDLRGYEKSARQVEQQKLFTCLAWPPDPIARHYLVAQTRDLCGHPSDLAPCGHSYFRFCLQPIIQIMPFLSTPLLE